MHRILGVWSLLFNRVLAVSGLYMMWYVFHPSYHTTAASAEKIGPPPAVHASLDSLMQRTKALIPGIHINYVNFPRNPGEVVSIMGHLPGGWLWGETTSYAEYDPSTGKAGTVFKEADLNTAEKIEYALYTLHYGQYGGKTIKMLYSFFGLAGALNTISGFFTMVALEIPISKKESIPLKEKQQIRCSWNTQKVNARIHRGFTFLKAHSLD